MLYAVMADLLEPCEKCPSQRAEDSTPKKLDDSLNSDHLKILKRIPGAFSAQSFYSRIHLRHTSLRVNTGAVLGLFC